MKLLTIICPVFNEEKNIINFLENVKIISNNPVIKNKYFLNVVFSNNRSTDKTLETIKEEAKKEDYIYFITLSKNFGYQHSIDFALRNTIGDLFVIIDVDGEDPVELILEFIKEHEKGFDIVYGERLDRPENVIKKKLRWLFYRVLHLVSDHKIFLDASEFSLFTNEVKENILKENNSFPFLRTSLSRVGFLYSKIPYVRKSRHYGLSNFNIMQNIKFAVAGILSSTTFPLRVPMYLFPLWCLLSTCLFILNLVFKKTIFLKILILIFVLYSSIILVFISIYVARIYQNSFSRPNAYLMEKNSRLQTRVKND